MKQPLLSFKSAPFILSLFLLWSTWISTSAQNCAVNASVSGIRCENSIFLLNGTKNGLFAPGNLSVWSQVSGPSVVILGANNNNPPAGLNHVATVLGVQAGNIYTFRITGYCQDGLTTSQTVTYTVGGVTTATAGTGFSFCPLASGVPVGTLSGNATSVPNEKAVWSGSGGPVVITNSNLATSTVHSGGNYGGGVRTLTWTITNTITGCASSSSLVVTNTGGNPTVSAGSNVTLSGCYSTTQMVNLNASLGGYAPAGQSGVWSVISGPNLPTFSNINANNATVSNLIQGVYVFRWTVSGPCVNGTATVTVTVPPPTQSVTPVTGNIGGATIYCDGRKSVVLNGVNPIYANEKPIWTPTSVTGAVIDNPNAPTVSISGLNGISNYTYRYHIVNTVTGCTSNTLTGTITYQNGAPVVTPVFSSTTTGCGATSVSIPFTVNPSANVTNSYSVISGPVTGMNGSGNSPFNITGLTTDGTYIVRISSQAQGVGSCPIGFADVAVTTSKMPSVANAGTPPAVACNVFQAALAGNAPVSGTGTWSLVSGPNVPTILSPNSPTATITGMTNGDYVFRWTIAAGPNCPPSSSEVMAKVASTVPGAAAAGFDQYVCKQTPIFVNANVPGPGETGTWSISPTIPAANLYPNINSNYLSIVGLNPGTVYTFTWTVANACNSGSDAINITVGTIAGPAQAFAGPSICRIGAFTNAFMAANAPAPTGATGTWTQLSGPTTAGFTGLGTLAGINYHLATVTGLTYGTYRFEWRLDRGGCAPTRDTVTVTIALASVLGANAGADISLCGNTTTLSGNLVSTVTGKWTQVSGAGGFTFSSTTVPSPVVSGLATGTYVFRWTLSNGVCPSTFDDVTVNVSSAPSLPNAGIDRTVCGSSMTTLAGNTITNGTGFWNVVGTAPGAISIINPTSPVTTVTGLDAGVYNFRWTAVGGPFCATQTDDVRISVSPPANAGPNVSVCNQTSVSLNGNEGTTGVWTMVSGPNTPNITSVSGTSANANNLTTGGYVFRYTANGLFGCPNSFSDKNVSISGFGTMPNAGPDQVVCNQTSVVLAGNTPITGVGSWSIISGSPGTTFTGGINNPTATITGLIPGVNGTTVSGVYVLRWNIANGACGSYADEVRITTHANPTPANAGPNQNNACSSTVTMAGNNITVGSGLWSLVSGPSTANFHFPMQRNTPVSILVYGVYVFRWSSSNGTCPVSQSDVTVTVTGMPPVQANAGANQQLCNQTTTTLTGNDATPYTSFWIQEAGPSTALFSSTTVSTPVISNLTIGAYRFRYTTKDNSCTSISVVSVTNFALPSGASITGGNVAYCPFEPVSFTAVKPAVGVGTWSIITGPGTPFISNPNNSTTGVAGLIPGNDYIIQWAVGSGSCAASVTSMNFTVKANCPPVGPNVTFTGLEDQLLVATLTGYTDPDNIIPTVTGGVFVSNLGYPLTISGLGTTTSAVLVRYQPGLNFNGIDNYTYQVCDQSTCTSAIITFSIVGINDPPVLLPMTTSGVNNTVQFTSLTGLVFGTVPGTYYDVDHSVLTFNGALVLTSTGILTTTVGYGQLTFSGTGGITFKPNSTTAGTYTFPMRVCDPFTCTSANLTIIVTNQPPVVYNQTIVGYSSVLLASTIPGYVGSTIPGSIWDADNSVVTINGTLPFPSGGTIVQTLPQGQITITGGGLVQFIANSTFSGVFNYPVSACDPITCTSGLIVFSITGLPPTDVAVTISGPSTALAGSSVVYSFTGKNNGPQLAPNTTFTGYLPVGLQGVGVCCGGTYSSVTGVVSWPSVSTVTVGGAVFYTMTFAGPASGVLLSTLTGYTQAPDTDLTNNKSMLTTTIIPRADMGVTISGPGTVLAGSTVYYTVLGVNHGPSEASNVTISGLLNSGLGVVTVSGGGVYNNGTGTIGWPVIPTVTLGGSVLYTLSYIAPPTGTILGVTSITSSVLDPNLANNISSIQTFIGEVADLAVSITGTTWAYIGDPIVITFSGKNNGPSVAANTTISGNLLPNQTVLGVSNGGVYAVSTGIVSWPVTHVGIGSDFLYTVTVVAPVTPALFGSTISGTTTTNEVSLANNKATFITTILGVADLIVQIAMPSSGVVGNPFVVTVTATNNGPSVAQSVLVLSTLPSELVIYGTTVSGTVNTSTGIVTWPTLATLGVGASQTYFIQVVPSIPGSFISTASGIHTLFDPNTVNNTHIKSATVVVVPANIPPIAIPLTFTGSKGQSIHNTITGFSDPDGPLPTVSSGVITTSSGFVVTLGGTGVFTYSPPTTFSGVDTFVYEVCDVAPACSTATVTLIINNLPPVAQNDTGSTKGGIPKTICVTANDSDSDGNIVLSSVSLGVLPSSIISASVNSLTGCITLTPATTFVGVVTVTYFVCDDGPSPVHCTQADIILTVNPNLPPVAQDDTASTKGGFPKVICVLDNDSDADSPLAKSSLKIVSSPLPAGILSAVVNTMTGCVTVTAAPTFTGVVNIRYEICDSLPLPGRCAEADIILTVNPNLPPVAQVDTLSKVAGSSKVVCLLGNDGDPDGQLNHATLEILGPIPSGITILPVNTTTGCVTITSINTLTGGVFSIPYRICDNGPNVMCTTANIVLTVIPRALSVTVTSFCQNDAAYVRWSITGKNFDASGLTADLVWRDTLGNLIQSNANQALSGQLLWPGAVVNANGVGIDWPGWLLDANGEWIQGDDGYLNARPKVNLSFTVNPTVSLTINYPPATEDCYTSGPQKPKVKADTLSGEGGQPTDICVLAKTTDADGVIAKSSIKLLLPLPSGVQAATVNTATGCITIVPATTFTGLLTVPFEVCDSLPLPSRCSQANLYISVTGGNFVTPVAYPKTVIGSSGQLLSFAIQTVSGSTTPGSVWDPENNSLTVGGVKLGSLDQIVIITRSEGVLTILGSGLVQFLPNTGFVGLVEFPISVCNPFTCVGTTFTFIIRNGPIAINDTAYTYNKPVKIPIATNDIKTQYDLDLSKIDLDPNTPGIQSSIMVAGIGVFVVDNEGILTFTPESNIMPQTITLPYLIYDVEGNASNIAYIVIVIEFEDFVIPEGFSPGNADGVNDELIITPPSDHDIVTLRVYNRWGNLVYVNDDYKNDWNGKPNRGLHLGGTLPEGTYYLSIQFYKNKKPIVRYITIK